MKNVNGLKKNALMATFLLIYQVFKPVNQLLNTPQTSLYKLFSRRPSSVQHSVLQPERYPSQNRLTVTNRQNPLSQTKFPGTSRKSNFFQNNKRQDKRLDYKIIYYYYFYNYYCSYTTIIIKIKIK